MTTIEPPLASFAPSVPSLTSAIEEVKPTTTLMTAPPPPSSGTALPTPEPLTYPPLPTSSTPPTTDKPAKEADAPMVGLTVLIISGQRKTFRFDGETTIGRVKEYIWNMWPSEWTDPALPPSPSYFRILFRGRMLDDESTLASNNLLPLPALRTTIVHLSVRTFLISPSDDGKDSSDRPALHTRASSRIRNLASAVVPAGRGPTEGARRSAAISEEGNRGDNHSGGCGCVVM